MGNVMLNRENIMIFLAVLSVPALWMSGNLTLHDCWKICQYVVVGYGTLWSLWTLWTTCRKKEGNNRDASSASATTFPNNPVLGFGPCTWRHLQQVASPSIGIRAYIDRWHWVVKARNDYGLLLESETASVKRGRTTPTFSQSETTDSLCAYYYNHTKQDSEPIKY